MKVRELIEKGIFELVNEGENGQEEIGGLFCCDLLSIAMGRAPAGGAWVTVMANINTLAVAALTETACVILAEGVSLDAAARDKAAEQGITVLRTEQPVFETALQVYGLLS